MPIPINAVYYVEIVTADVEAARRLYSRAYGWTFEGPKAELGHALVAQLPGGSLCGIRAPMHAQEEPVVRTYIRVADADAAAKEAESMGATLALPPMDIPGRGRIAIYSIGGVQQGLWQLP